MVYRLVHFIFHAFVHSWCSVQTFSIQGRLSDVKLQTLLTQSEAIICPN